MVMPSVVWFSSQGTRHGLITRVAPSCTYPRGRQPAPPARRLLRDPSLLGTMIRWWRGGNGGSRRRVDAGLGPGRSGFGEHSRTFASSSSSTSVRPPAGPFGRRFPALRPLRAIANTPPQSHGILPDKEAIKIGTGSEAAEITSCLEPGSSIVDRYRSTESRLARTRCTTSPAGLTSRVRHLGHSPGWSGPANFSTRIAPREDGRRGARCVTYSFIEARPGKTGWCNTSLTLAA
jgi:hypothetical protein